MICQYLPKAGEDRTRVLLISDPDKSQGDEWRWKV